MALRIDLPDGRVALIDELTGDIVGMEQPQEPPPPGSNYPQHGGLAGPSGVGSQAITGEPGGGVVLPPPPGSGGSTSAPPGYIWVQDPIDGTLKLVTDRTFSAGSGTLSPNTVYTQQQQNVRDAAAREQQQAQLVQQQQQFIENFGADKAKFNIEQTERERADRAREVLDREQLDVTRGNTLLQLGSRPDTLIRYLNALRGQQAPQGLGVPPALPGYSNVAGVSAGAPAIAAQQAPSIAAPANVQAPSAAPAISAAPNLSVPIQTDRGWMNPGSATTAPSPVANQSAVFEQPGTLPPGIREALDAERAKQAAPTAQAAATPIVEPRPAPSLVNPANLSPGLQPVAQSVQFAPSGTQFASGAGEYSDNDILNQIRSREQYNAYQRSIGGKEAASLKYDPSVGRLYAGGGVIPEPVMGIGMHSGQKYMLGEEGEEVVVPKDKVPHDIFERLMKDAEEVDYSEDKTGKRHVKVKRGMNSYAEGGTLGYKPIDPKVFNPSSISNDFDFPQIGNLTGGTSLVPSAQRLFDALPSERSLYAGYLQDEQGVQSDDVFELARRLAPQTTGMTAGRFVN